jgi:hypothetical protein
MILQDSQMALTNTKVMTMVAKVNTFFEGVFQKNCDIRRIDKIEFGVAQKRS